MFYFAMFFQNNNSRALFQKCKRENIFLKIGVRIKYKVVVSGNPAYDNAMSAGKHLIIFLE